MGALIAGPPPPESQWMVGTLAFSRSAFGGAAPCGRRLVLRDPRANTNRGLLADLYAPALVDVQAAGLRLRGIEPVALGQQQQAAVVQEWLVLPLL